MKILLIVSLSLLAGCTTLITRQDLKSCSSSCQQDGHQLDRVFKMNKEACCVCK